MDSRQIRQVAEQANAVGKPYGVFCCYKMDAPGQWVWIFYRRGPFKCTRLGKTGDPEKVVKKMEGYTKCTR